MKIITTLLIIVVHLCAAAQTKVAIIGGGIAGIASAHYIHQFDPKAQITIFEKESQLGGNAQSITVKNSRGENVVMDIGPQYFAKGPWDQYLQFLNETIGIKNIESETVDASLLIQKMGQERPFLISPHNGKLRGEKISNLLKFRKFDIAAYHVYKNPEKWRGKSIDDWLPTVKLEETYKTEVVLPFLAATLGTTVNAIRKTSVVELVKLFAFRKPKLKTEFQIMKEGMGGLLLQIGKKLEADGVTIKTSSPVSEIIQTSLGFEVKLAAAESVQEDPMHFDFVVMAVHANVASTILPKNSNYSELSNTLKSLPYFKVNVVVHTDTNFINTKMPTFLNIYTNQENELAFTTMNQSIISDRLNGIYKSWVNEKQKQQIQERGHLLSESTFWLSMITPAFIENVKKVNDSMMNNKNLVIIGGWSEGLETQNSAVLSAQRSLEKYKNFKK